MPSNQTLLVALGGIFFAAAMLSYLRTKRKLRSWRETMGTVVELKRELKSEGFMFSAVIAFRTMEEGALVKFQDPLWSDPPSHAAGEKVRVMYDPLRPESAALKGYRPYLITFVWLFAGIFSLAIVYSQSR